MPRDRAWADSSPARAGSFSDPIPTSPMIPIPAARARSMWPGSVSFSSSIAPAWTLMPDGWTPRNEWWAARAMARDDSAPERPDT